MRNAARVTFANSTTRLDDPRSFVDKIKVKRFLNPSPAPQGAHQVKPIPLFVKE